TSSFSDRENVRFPLMVPLDSIAGLWASAEGPCPTILRPSVDSGRGREETAVSERRRTSAAVADDGVPPGDWLVAGSVEALVA
ncbi:MAG: hypothetical protein DRJ50_02070, partial [Actinobacteria bacterium]